MFLILYYDSTTSCIYHKHSNKCSVLIAIPPPKKKKLNKNYNNSIRAWLVVLYNIPEVVPDVQPDAVPDVQPDVDADVQPDVMLLPNQVT